MDLAEIEELKIVEKPTVALMLNHTIDWDDNCMNQTRVIVDLTILSMGFCLNIVILVAILTKKRLHNSTGCYVFSLTVSNLVVLLNVVDDVIHYWFHVHFKPDLDFVGRVTLQSSALTLVVFSLDRYITLCRVPSKWREKANKLSTGVNAVVIIWSFAVIATAMELNLYVHLLPGTIINLFCWSTALYLLLPTFVIVFLSGFSALESVEFRGLARPGNSKDFKGLRLLASLVLSFYVTMVPQRVATILYYKAPQLCCTALTMNICYYLAKVSSIVDPIICLGSLRALECSRQLKPRVKYPNCRNN